MLLALPAVVAPGFGGLRNEFQVALGKRMSNNDVKLLEMPGMAYLDLAFSMERDRAASRLTIRAPHSRIRRGFGMVELFVNPHIYDLPNETLIFLPTPKLIVISFQHQVCVGILLCFSFIKFSHCLKKTSATQQSSY